ncbi:MAG: hypothetical protein Q9M20_08710 [Mariprofundaceae bacterium]|nr:hypothetical protein [Mariprofundaceae bacterium]
MRHLSQPEKASPAHLYPLKFRGSLAFQTLFLLILCGLSHATWAASYTQKALQYEQQEQWSEARRAWKFALIEQPKDLDVRYHLAKILAKAGHANDALILYKKNLLIGRHLHSVIALVQLYMQKEQRLEAMNVLHKASKDFRHEAAPWYLLAALAIQDKKIKQAQYYFQSSMKADPLNGFAHIRYAHFLAVQKQYKQAVRHAQKALRLQKNCASCWEIYGKILQAAKNKQAALRAYQHSLAIQPSQNTRQKLIDLLNIMGQQQRAERMQQAFNAQENNL